MSALFTRLAKWFGFGAATPEWQGPGIRPEQACPGTRVRSLDGTEGTITRAYQRGEQFFVRVVFTAPRASWVSLISTTQLELA